MSTTYLEAALKAADSWVAENLPEALRNGDAYEDVAEQVHPNLVEIIVPVLLLGEAIRVFLVYESDAGTIHRRYPERNLAKELWGPYGF